MTYHEELAARRRQLRFVQSKSLDLCDFIDGLRQIVTAVQEQVPDIGDNAIGSIVDCWRGMTQIRLLAESGIELAESALALSE